MQYVDQLGTMKLNNIACKGLPTLSAGTYTGHFIGSKVDVEGITWITVVTKEGSHIENTDLDLNGLDTNCPIEFDIDTVDGCVAIPKGSYYKLVNNGEDVTKFLPLPTLYQYIRENNVKLAELKITRIKRIG